MMSILRLLTSWWPAPPVEACNDAAFDPRCYYSCESARADYLAGGV